jgi:hypothetical protein
MDRAGCDVYDAGRSVCDAAARSQNPFTCRPAAVASPESMTIFTKMEQCHGWQCILDNFARHVEANRKS